MTTYSLTWFRRRTVATDGLRVELDDDELRFALADAGPHNGTKKALPLISTATFRNGHRANADVETVSLLGLDLDDPVADPDATLARLVGALGGVGSFAYSSFSSQSGAFKLRVLIPYDVPATAAQHSASWLMVERILARAGIEIDAQCKDPARGFFVWAIPPTRAYWHASTSGPAWPVALAADAAEEVRQAEEASRPRPRRAHAVSTPLVERARRYVAKMPPAISGAGGHAATFAVARRLVADFELDEASAWDLLCEFNERCEPRWSEKELRHKLVSATQARVRVDMGGRS